ncbi:hypothetical protein [Planctomycetes bacterium K23_9]|uniref:Uncharacterized protein n=1 Tax=Stieleria marina TaxID=1930275 RepID=A0A517NQD0_9BACT|nr:hypothetical protein K239x_12700 [Planctomycetes bacterium K23_9]
MNRQLKSTILVVAALAGIVANTLPASACGGRGGGFGGFGGGFGGGLSRSFPRPSISRPSMNFRRPTVKYQTSQATSVYSQPSYAQPQYSQPVYSQSVHSQSVYVQPTQPQTIYSQPASSQVTYQQPSTPSISAQAVPQPTTQSTVPQRSMPVVSQTTNQQPSATSSLRTQTMASTITGQTNSVNPANVATPATSPAAQPATTQTPAQKSAPTTAQQSALQALASISKAGGEATKVTPETTTTIPQFTAATATLPNTTAGHVGTWRVSLPGSQSVELNLASDGTFTWTATKNGKSSKFDGEYRLAQGRLTLVRSADLQQMVGDWTANDSGFAFKLDGTKTGGLNFKRS